MEEVSRKKLLSWAILLFCISLLCFTAVILPSYKVFAVNIEPDERGIVITSYQSPRHNKILEPGWHFMIPGERVQIYDISPQTYTMLSPDSIRAKTLDGKEIFVETSIVYAVEPNKVTDLYVKWQNQYEDGIVRPESRGITRDVLSKYNANETSTQLLQIEQSIVNELKKQLTENFLILIKFSITAIRDTP